VGHRFTIKDYYQVKRDGDYPWPCGPDPDRTIRLHTDDVLTKSENGSFTKHTGLGCLNIRLTDDEVNHYETDTVTLEMM
jgi:hypothetical protein